MGGRNKKYPLRQTNRYGWILGKIGYFLLSDWRGVGVLCGYLPAVSISSASPTPTSSTSIRYIISALAFRATQWQGYMWEAARPLR